MRIRGRAAALGAAVATSAALVVIPTGTAGAASSCWDAHFKSADPMSMGNVHYAEAYYCNNAPSAPVYASLSTSSRVVGHLYSGTNWFVCRADGGGHVGGTHPSRWEWTQSDDGANGGWGWVKDTSISSETNSMDIC